MELLLYSVDTCFVVRDVIIFLINDDIDIRIIEYFPDSRKKEYIVALLMQIFYAVLSSLFINVEIDGIIFNLEYFKSPYPCIDYDLGYIIISLQNAEYVIPFFFNQFFHIIISR